MRVAERAAAAGALDPHDVAFADDARQLRRADGAECLAEVAEAVVARAPDEQRGAATGVAAEEAPCAALYAVEHRATVTSGASTEVAPHGEPAAVGRSARVRHEPV